MPIYKPSAGNSFSGGSLTTRVDFPATSFDIGNPPIRFTDLNVSNDNSAKGNIIEWGGTMTPGTTYNYGIATQAYKDNPAATFTVPGTNGVPTYKKWAWVLAHYNSPAVTGEVVHQHLNLETVKADWLTVITRFQISFGEDVALVSFPNSNVKFYPDFNVQLGNDAAGVYIKHDTTLARIVLDTATPFSFPTTSGIKVGTAGAPGGKVHTERADDGTLFYAKSTLAGGNSTPGTLLEAASSGGTSLAMKVTGESINRFSSNHSGKLEWGSGAATRDTNLYRAAASNLKTDYKFIAALGVNIGAGVTVPTTATSTGVQGDIAYDASFVYICTATNTWKRVGVATW